MVFMPDFSAAWRMSASAARLWICERICSFV